MTREEFIKEQIKLNGYTLKSFAAELKIPYTTLLSMLKDNIGGAAVETVIEICQKLNIPVEVLRKDNVDFYSSLNGVDVNSYELVLLKKLRRLSEDDLEDIEAMIDAKLARRERKYKKDEESCG